MKNKILLTGRNYLLTALIFLAQALLPFISSAQNCPAITGWNLVTVSNDGLGNCTYRVDFTMTVNGSNKSVQILVSCNGSAALNECIGVNSGQNGTTISSSTFSCSCTSSKSLIFNSFTNGICGGASCTSSGNVLPLNISSFFLKQVNDQQCLLWKIEEQSNVHNYTVEYSLNGNDFTALGLLNPAASPDYYFCDPVKRESGFYRLKITMAGGQVKYSAVLKFSASGLNTIDIFPNPAKDKLNIEVPALLALENVSYVIYYPDGSRVLPGKLTNSFIDVSKLPAGIYYLCIRSESGVLLKKIFIKG